MNRLSLLCMALALSPVLSSAGEIVPGRSVIATRGGMVASSQPLAAAAAVRVLDAGGNAMDAAITANACVGVMEPTGNGIGGDLFVLIYEAKSGRIHGLNASGWAPAGLTPEVLAAKGLTRMPEKGIHAVTVPGVVAGWAALNERFGAKPLGELLQPAIRAAEEGFPLMEITAHHWKGSEKWLTGIPEAAKTWLVNGQAPAAGEVFKNPALAGSLRRIAEQGRAGFYEGETAAAILAVSQSEGGTMTAADLSEFRAEWVDPISIDYRGWRVTEIPPNTQGIAALSMLAIMENFPIHGYGLHSPDALHVAIEAKKLAYADMLAFVGDPRTGNVPVQAMLHKEHAAERARLINPMRAMPKAEPSVFPGLTDSKGHDTIYLCTADREGNVVSLIQSNYMGFGSGVVPAGCGFMLHNRGALFILEPGKPNTLAPRKRPLHTIIPGMMSRAGTVIGFGIMGGWNQAQAHAQFVSNIADFDLSIQQALEAARFTKPTFEGLDVILEAGIPETSRAALDARGHQTTAAPLRTSTFGYGQAVMTTPAGVRFGASDPRHDGAAIPQP
ncbi:MAG: gamma-glutamyltransferase [Verrucomicrobiaceae bacterium]|nr:MAG: gamma-glutamyltransferase [Verrucomicrobiaceae bacterium]